MVKGVIRVAFLGITLAAVPTAQASVYSYLEGLVSKMQSRTTATNTTLSTPSVNPNPVSTSNYRFDIDAQARKLSAEARNLDPRVVKLGLEAYSKARGAGLDQEQILTIVDYHIPSTQPRLFVFDLKTNNLLFKELVAHGKNSGDNVPTSFSNAPSSLKSSLGVFLTQNTYIGHHGYSLRLAGLERGFNDMAAAREIVVHAANYVNTAFAHAHGRLGKSWGCFAVDPTIASSLISTIKGGTLIFAYYPDHNYLSRSSFLT